MNVKEFIDLLKQFPPQTKVVLYGEMGSDEMESDSMNLETMDYVKIFSGFEPHGYIWDYPGEHKDGVILTEKVVLIK